MARPHVLVVGADGFVGRHVVAALLARGVRVTCATRHPDRTARIFPPCASAACDLSVDDVQAWGPRLKDVDTVVNADGILRGPVHAVQSSGPVALFDACVQAGVRQVVQISALGAGLHPSSPFLASKDAADRHLIALARNETRPNWHVVRPSLIVGRGGRSTDLFCALAALPWPLRLGPGTWVSQPVHVHDVVRILLDLMDGARHGPLIDLVGGSVMSSDDLTRALRDWMGLRATRFLTIPEPCLRLAAKLGDRFPGWTLTGESFKLLTAGNVASPQSPGETIAVRPLRLALATDPATGADLTRARWSVLTPMLVACLAVVWVGSGLASFAVAGPHAVDLLRGLGLSMTGSRGVVWCGALLDVALGTALLRRSRRRVVLVAQACVVLGYTALASILLPGLWLDPFGALLKNLAVLATTLVLLTGEDA